jgi:paraquat-inducible protein B
MKNEDPDNIDIEELPEIAVQKKRRFSIVWIIPIVAALVGGWLPIKPSPKKAPLLGFRSQTVLALKRGKQKSNLET